MTRAGRSAGRPAHRVLHEVGDDPLEQRGVGAHRAQRLRHVVDDAVRALAEARDRGGHDLLEVHRPQRRLQHAGLQAAHVEQVRHQRGEAVGLLLDGLEELGLGPARDHSMSVWRRLDADALIDASGVRRSCETAWSSAVRSSLAWVSSVACAAAADSRARSPRRGELRRERVQHLAVGAGEPAADQREHDVRRRAAA